MQNAPVQNRGVLCNEHCCDVSGRLDRKSQISGRSTIGVGIAQDIAPAPNRMNVVVAFGCRLDFLAQFADKDVNNLVLFILTFL